jgi:oligopeptide transport system substrate-binding protein
MRLRHPWGWLAALFSVLALAAAGCGGGDDDDGAAGTTGEAAAAAEQVITVNWGAEPPSLDPGLATDVTSGTIILNIMDPLVRLGDDLEPVPSAAASWETSQDGKTVTFTLRDDLKWTNGDKVTAQDFEYSWKRTMSPDLAADYAYQFYGIVGASEFNECKKNCKALEDKVGVNAVDDTTLEVKLTTPQPWFIQQAAHHSFLAVHKATVDKFKDKWTEPANIVTNGPFKLDSWAHNANINLVKWDGWRDADSVKLTRVNGRMITDGTTAVQAFEAGEIDVLYQGLPPDEIARLKETPEYEQYPGLGTYYYGFNVKNITDVKQRRAMSLAIDRQSIIDNIAQGGQLPTTGFTPKGMPGFDDLNPDSPWQPPSADMEQAKKLMGEVASPKKNITLYINDSPGHKDIAVAIQAAWKELGITSTIKQQEFQQYLEFLGPPPNADVDVYRLGWIGDFVDAINFLDLWTCKSGNNNTNFCDKDYDAVIQKAKNTVDTDARYKLYGEAEDILGGENGQMPVMPIYWYTYVNLERENVKASFSVNLLNQTDLTQVVVTE